MVITEISEADVLSACRRTTGLPEGAANTVEDELLAALLRRSAGIHCPCSRAALRSGLLESLRYLDDDADTLPGRIDDMVDGLIVGGDLLELSDVTTDDPHVKGTWVFAAPPSFVVRPSGSIFILGVVPDQDAFLPRSLTNRIVHTGFSRVLTPEDGEDLATDLAGHGLQQLSVNAWLKAPKRDEPEDHLAALERRLRSQPPSGAVADLQILDTEKPVTYYRGRWTTPKTQSGTYVGRRPQDYGAPLWCFAQLEDGTPQRILDLPPGTSRWRGCDAAWHLQMAIDRCRNTPQCYKRTDTGDAARFDFYSPLPQWAQRRFMIFGQSVTPERCLISYILPAVEAETEEQFLCERLWLQSATDSDREHSS